jgi:penicillin-binding protein 1C
MEKVSGVTGAGPSWNAIMQELHRNRPSREPVLPEKITSVNIKHPWSSLSKKEFFIKGTEPSHSEIELANDKQVQFIFPAEGSILIEDPHLDPDRIALAIRFKGTVLENSVLLWDGKALGAAVSPFIVSRPKTGEHHLAIRSPDGKIVAQVRFVVKGQNWPL